jgi:hypothetical protein
MSVLDSVFRPSQRSIPELVDALREIHKNKTTRAHAPSAMLQTADEREGPDLLSLPRLILERLARGSDDLAGLLASAPESTQSAAARHYSALRGCLEGMGREAREHVEAVDRLLGFQSSSASKSARSAYQETLYLQCSQGGRSGGRVRCVNHRGQRMSVSAVPRPFSTTGKSLKAAPMLTLRPDKFCQDAGESQFVLVEVDLAPCSDLSSCTLETSIDLLVNDAVTHKIWIEIIVYERT